MTDNHRYNISYARRRQIEGTSVLNLCSCLLLQRWFLLNF